MENKLTTYAINGFGRIGKLTLRVLLSKNANVAFINDPKCTPEIVAYQLEFDSVHGRFDQSIKYNKSSIMINGKEIFIYDKVDIKELPNGVADIVIDCSGKFKSKSQFPLYADLGIKKAIISAAVPDDVGINIVYGVNQSVYKPMLHHVLSASSCTTNCLAPVVKALHDSIGIKHGSYTTIHNVTNTQTIVDRPAKDLRRSRSALTNLIPSTTNSAKAITQIYPELTNKLTGHAVRIPILNASLVDCCFEMVRSTSIEEINKTLKSYAEHQLNGILGFEERPLVSSDYIGDSRSSIIDGVSTLVVNDTQVKIYAWYDNEFGYSNRLVDVAELAGKFL
jgi:glyceraldehyde 3-phosphate dehydrogenase